MLNETMELAKADAKDAWDGEGYYAIGWSDGGMDWTNNGPVWFDSEEDLAAEIACAYAQSSDTHLPWAEKYGEPFQQYELDALLGDFKDDFDIDGIIDEATEMHDGVRYWVVPENELEALIERYDRR